MSFKKEKLAFWGDGVERRSVTLGYTMETGEYAEENYQVLFCGNLPAVVFDFEDRHKAESMPVATRPLTLLKRKPRPRPDESWEKPPRIMTLRRFEASLAPSTTNLVIQLEGGT